MEVVVEKSADLVEQTEQGSGVRVTQVLGEDQKVPAFRNCDVGPNSSCLGKLPVAR
jgi:hypothetical protein